MHAAMILHRCLAPLLQHIHSRRLAALLAAVVACVSGPRLTLSDVARRLEGSARLRHEIKRADRLLGNHPLQGEARSIYAAQCRVLLARIGAPLLLIDWSELKADPSLPVLRASLPLGGRSLTLYEEVHPQKGWAAVPCKRASCAAWPACCRRVWPRSSSPMPASRCRFFARSSA